MFLVKIKNLIKEKTFANKNYLQLFILLFLIIIFVKNNIFQWLTVVLVIFSIMSNDSIQTIGTYLATHENEKWYKLFFLIGSMFTFVIVTSWILYKGELHFGILNKIHYEEEFNISYFLAPLFLLLLNTNGIPSSSTFLILSLFSNGSNIFSMLSKTIFSYVVSFTFACYVWYVVLKKFKHLVFKEHNYSNLWEAIQKITTFVLICTWLMSNLANMVVFLPRTLCIHTLCLFLFIFLYILIIILRNKGGRLQEIINKKHDAKNVKVSIITNLNYSIILIFFKYVSNIPISTTFVLLGVLAAKEVMTTLLSDDIGFFSIKRRYKECLVIILNDLRKGFLGIGISLCFIKLINILGLI